MQVMNSEELTKHMTQRTSLYSPSPIALLQMVKAQMGIWQS